MSLSPDQRAALRRPVPEIWPAVRQLYTPESAEALDEGLREAGVPDLARRCTDADWRQATHGRPPTYWPLVRTIVRDAFEPMDPLDLARITCLVQRQARGEAVDGPLLDLTPEDLAELPALHTLVPGGNAIDLDTFPVLERIAHLDLRGMEVRGLERLADWPALRHLGVHPGANLPDLPTVEVLDLGGAWEIDLSRLGALPALHTLMLREIDELHHADALRRLPALERVLCGGTALDVELDGVSVEA